MDVVTVAIAKQMDDRRDILQYPDGPLNPPRPLTPTADATWATPPSDLDHCVDGNPSTKTGVGETVVGGVERMGILFLTWNQSEM